MSYINRYLSFFSYKHANFNADPFIFTASILNYKSDFKSLDAYFNAHPFYLTASKTTFRSDFNSLETNFNARPSYLTAFRTNCRSYFKSYEVPSPSSGAEHRGIYSTFRWQRGRGDRVVNRHPYALQTCFGIPCPS